MNRMIQILSVSTILACAPLMAQAQTSDTIRIMQLEENNRQLNGQVEELRFQMLEMQENLRKMQEDNEFRFQELEDQSDATDTVKDDSLGKQQPSDTSNTQEESDGKKRESIADIIENSGLSGGSRRVIDGVEIFDPERDRNADSAISTNRTLGTIIFDSNGNMIDNNQGSSPIQLVPNSGQQTTLGQQETLPQNPEELFDLAYQYFLGGDHERSSEAFQSYVSNFPDGKQISDANFWLGESLFSLRRYEDAARVFLSNHKQFPNGRLAPQNLLKLGVSLAALNQRELACATYAEVPKLYPAAANAVSNRVKVEQRSAKCQG